MKKILFAFLLLATAAADTNRFGKVAVVLSAQGAKLQKPGEPASRLYPLQSLDSLEIGQILKLEANSEVTLSVLSSGVRYRLTGPLSLPITADFRSGKELPSQAGRAGLAASQQVDLSKFGGSSGRKTGFPVYTDGSALSLDLDVVQGPFQASTLKVSYRAAADEKGAWTPVEASLYHHSNQRDQLRLTAPLEAEKDYLVYIGDKANPTNEEAQFRVLRLPPKAVDPLRELEKSAGDWPAQIELFQAYWHLRLFAKAEPLLQQMRQQHPQGVNWKALLDKFEADRREAKS